MRHRVRPIEKPARKQRVLKEVYPGIKVSWDPDEKYYLIFRGPEQSEVKGPDGRRIFLPNHHYVFRRSADNDKST